MSSIAQFLSSDTPKSSPYTLHSSYRSPSLLDLPIEAQVEIVGHVSRKTLHSLQLVSKHFHGLASARLYAHLAFVLTHPESQYHYTSPPYRLGDALHTFATSDHDYAQYIKYFGVSLLEHDADDIQRRVVSRFHYQEESTKLLNTTLVLVIRKAKALESFNWEVPIEVSGQVYGTLGKIQSLQDLSIHLDTAAVPRAVYAPYNPNMPGMPPVTGQQQVPFPGATQHAVPLPIPQALGRVPKFNVSIARSGKRKFSSIKGLQKIQVTGIENLDCLDEISACVQQCSSSLKSLSLSLSQHLARKARKSAVGAPNTNVAVDALDDEDDDATQPATPPPTSSAPQPTEADVKRERKIQESILGRVFGFETVPLEDKKVDKSLKAAASKMVPALNHDEQFLQHVKNAVSTMAKVRSTTGNASSLAEPFFAKLDKAVDKYLQSSNEKKKKPVAKHPATNKPKPPPPSFGFISQTLPQSQYLGSGSSSSMGPGGLPGGINLNKLNQEFLEIFGTETPTLQDLENFMAVNNSLSPGYPKKPASTYPSFSSSTISGPSTFTIGNSTNLKPSNNPLYTYAAQNGLSSSASGLLDPSKPISNDFDVSDVALKNHYSTKTQASNYNYAPKWQFANKVPPAKLSDFVPYVVKDGSSVNGTQGNGQHEIEQSSPTDSESSDSEAEDKGSKDVSNLPVSVQDPGEADREDDMDIDMEHPDVIEGQSDEDQDMLQEDPELPQSAAAPLEMGLSWDPQPDIPEASLQKGKSKLVEPPVASATMDICDPKVETDVVRTRAANTEETMREYIRMNHGFSLENLVLYLIPLRPSILAKALDLSFLRSITLLSVGPQGAFWKMVEKFLDESVPIHLRSIQTDDVSLAFLTCASKLSGLEDLYMIRRNSKDFDCTTTKAPPPLEDIRRLVLRKRLGTLQRLAIVSEEESWDLDSQCIRLLAAKGKALKELAFCIEINDYHTFLQCLPGLHSLVAINLVAIRTGDRISALSRESRRFLLDVCHHCPRLGLKYVGMSGIVYEIGRKHRVKTYKKVNKEPTLNENMHNSPSSKGKGKEKASSIDEKVMAGAREEQEEAENLSEIELGSPEVAFVKHHKFWDVPSISIFDKKIRKARI